MGEVNNRRGKRVRFNKEKEIFGKNENLEKKRIYRMER